MLAVGASVVASYMKQGVRAGGRYLWDKAVTQPRRRAAMRKEQIGYTPGRDDWWGEQLIQMANEGWQFIKQYEYDEGFHRRELLIHYLSYYYRRRARRRRRWQPSRGLPRGFNYTSRRTYDTRYGQMTPGEWAAWVHKYSSSGEYRPPWVGPGGTYNPPPMPEPDYGGTGIRRGSMDSWRYLNPANSINYIFDWLFGRRSGPNLIDR